VIERISLGIMSVGSGHTVEALRWVMSLDGVAGEMTCRDCYPRPGSGLFEGPYGRRVRCTTCKGSGRVLVSL
jgi:hypothetical protein